MLLSLLPLFRIQHFLCYCILPSIRNHLCNPFILLCCWSWWCRGSHGDVSFLGSTSCPNSSLSGLILRNEANQNIDSHRETSHTQTTTKKWLSVCVCLKAASHLFSFPVEERKQWWWAAVERGTRWWWRRRMFRGNRKERKNERIEVLRQRQECERMSVEPRNIYISICQARNVMLFLSFLPSSTSQCSSSLYLNELTDCRAQKFFSVFHTLTSESKSKHCVVFRAEKSRKEAPLFVTKHTSSLYVCISSERDPVFKRRKNPVLKMLTSFEEMNASASFYLSCEERSKGIHGKFVPQTCINFLSYFGAKGFFSYPGRNIWQNLLPTHEQHGMFKVLSTHLCFYAKSVFYFPSISSHVVLLRASDTHEKRPSFDFITSLIHSPVSSLCILMCRS